MVMQLTVDKSKVRSVLKKVLGGGHAGVKTFKKYGKDSAGFIFVTIQKNGVGPVKYVLQERTHKLEAGR